MNTNELVKVLKQEKNKDRDVNAIIIDKNGNIVVFSVEGNTKHILDTLKLFNHC